MSFGVIGEDSSVLIELGQYADGTAPSYGASGEFVTICRRCTIHDSVDMKMTSGIGRARKVHRAGQSMSDVTLDLVVQNTGASLRGYKGYYIRVTANEHTALASPAPLEGILSDWKMDISDDPTIESITVTCDADTL